MDAFSETSDARTRQHTVDSILADHENVIHNTRLRITTYQLSKSLRRHRKQDSAFVFSPHSRICTSLAEFTLKTELNCGMKRVQPLEHLLRQRLSL